MSKENYKQLIEKESESLNNLLDIEELNGVLGLLVFSGRLRGQKMQNIQFQGPDQIGC